MIEAVGCIALAYAIGSIPVAQIVARATKGVDLREAGSGNVGASNVWQSVERWLVVPVGLAQIGQGVAATGIPRLLDAGDGVAVASAIACVVANNWNPWLGLDGGRGIGATIGALIVLAPIALAAFVVIALLGVALGAIPQAVALGLLATPVAAAVSGEGVTVVVGCAALAAIALAKRLTANGPPDASAERPAVWWRRLALDRDVSDREEWVRR